MALRLALDPTALEAGAARGKAALDGLTPAAFRAESAIEAMAKQGAESLLQFDRVVNNAAVSSTAMGAAFAATSGQTRALDTSLSGLTAATMQAEAATDAETMALAEQAAALTRLQGQLSPAVAAKERFAEAEMTVAAAVRAGIVTQDEANRTLDQARAKYLALEPAAVQAGAAAKAAGAGTSSFGFMAQNASFQIADFAVQVAAGTSATRAMAQQLPQMLAGFGLWGAAIGAVVAVAGALVPVLFNVRDATKEANAANEAYGDSLGTVRSDISAATSLYAEYVDAVRHGQREVVEAIQLEARARQALLELDKIELVTRQQEAVKAQAEAHDALVAAEAQLQDRQDQISRIAADLAAAKASSAVGLGGNDPNSLQGDLELANAELQRQTAELVKQQAIYEKTSSEYKLIAAQVDVLNAKQKANTDILGLMADGVLDVTGGLNSATGAANAFGGALSVAAGYAASIQSSINGISFGNIAKAAQLAALQGGASPVEAANAGTVAQARAQLAPIQQSSLGGNLFTNQLIDQTAAGLAQQADVQAKIDAILAAQNHGSGGGGGTSQIDQTRQAYDALLASLDPVVSATQELQKAQTTVNAAQAAGVITAEEAARANALAQKQFEETIAGINGATSAWEAFKDAGASAIDKLIDGTGSLKDALGDMLKEMAKAILQANLLKHVTGGTSGMSLGALIMQGITGGFHDAGGTIPTGMRGVVGEFGPEIVESTASGARVTSRVETARMAESAMSGRQNVHVTVGVAVDEGGNLKAYVKSIAQSNAVQAASAAVQHVKDNLSGWNGALQRDGAI